MIHHRKLKDSFKFAFEGLGFAISKNQNLRIHFIIGITVAIAGIFLGLNPFEMGIIWVMILLVIASEMVNTAIEQMVDLITIEHRKEAKIAKDVSAGMVLVASIGSLIVGIMIFTPYIVRLFK